MALLLGRGTLVSSLSCLVDPAGSGALGEKLCGQPPAEGVCHLLRPVGELAQGAGNDRHAGPRDLSGLESPIVRAAASEACPGTVLLQSAKKRPLKWPLAHSWGNLRKSQAERSSAASPSCPGVPVRLCPTMECAHTKGAAFSSLCVRGGRKREAVHRDCAQLAAVVSGLEQSLLIPLGVE